MKFNDVIKELRKLKGNNIRNYANAYKVEEGRVIYTDGYGLIVYKVDTPEPMHNKIYSHLGIESELKYPRTQLVIEGNEDMVESSISISLLREALKYIKSGSNLIINKDGINMNGEGLGSMVLINIFKLIPKCLDITKIEEKDGPTFKLSVGEHIDVYIASTRSTTC